MLISLISLQKTFFVYLAQQIPEKEIEHLKQVFIATIIYLFLFINLDIH